MNRVVFSGLLVETSSFPSQISGTTWNRNAFLTNIASKDIEGYTQAHIEGGKGKRVI
jgi:hypothetical protein